MNTLARIIITSIVSILMLSCNFSMHIGEGIDGNGNVVNTDRDISDTFNSIKVSQGLELFITQSKDLGLNVEADENLQEVIKTEVENGVLKIYTTDNIRRASSKKVMLSFDDITSIKATSGSSVKTTNTIEIDELEVNSTSGSNLNLDIKTTTLSCKSTSGSHISLSGETQNLTVKATSGSHIKASDLISQTSNVKATSGAHIKVNTLKQLTANATSGANIRYSGNPKKISKSDSSSGSVSQQ